MDIFIDSMVDYIPNQDIVEMILKDAFFLYLITDTPQYCGTLNGTHPRLVIEAHKVVKLISTNGFETRSEFNIIAIDYRKRILYTMWSNLFISESFRFFEFQISEDFLTIALSSKELPYCNSIYQRIVDNPPIVDL